MSKTTQHMPKEKYSQNRPATCQKEKSHSHSHFLGNAIGLFFGNAIGLFLAQETDWLFFGNAIGLFLAQETDWRQSVSCVLTGSRLTGRHKRLTGRHKRLTGASQRQ